MSQPPSSWFSASQWKQWASSKVPQPIKSVWNALPQGVKDTTKVVGTAGAGYVAAPIIGTAAALGGAGVATAGLMPDRVKRLFNQGTAQIARVIDAVEAASSQSSSNSAPVENQQAAVAAPAVQDNLVRPAPSVPISQHIASAIDTVIDSTPALLETAGSVIGSVQEYFQREVEKAPPLPIEVPDLQRPLIVGGNNINPFTPNVAAASERTTDAITDAILRTRENRIVEEEVQESVESDDEEERLEATLEHLEHIPNSNANQPIPLPIALDHPMDGPVVPIDSSSTLHLNSVGAADSPVVAVGPPGPLALPIDGLASLAVVQPPASEEEPASPLTPIQEVEAKVEKTNGQLNQFNQNLQAYATLNILHEFVADQKAPVGGIYREIMREFEANKDSKPSLWKIYMKHLGKDLTFFQKVKAALFYFFLYSLTGIIPTAAEEFASNVINTFRNDITKGTAIETLTKFILAYSERFLNVSIGAIQKFHEEHGIGGSIDDYKQKALDQLIEDLFQKSLEETLPEIGEIVVREFYVPINFFKKWKNSKGPLSWIGRVFSSLFDRPLNAIVRTVLRKKVLPTVLGSLLNESQNSTPERMLVVRRAVYETAIEQLRKIPAKIRDPNPRKPLPNLRGAEKLPTVSGLLTKYLTLVPLKTPDALSAILKKKNIPNNLIEIILQWFQEGGRDLIQKGIQKGIEDTSRIGLSILHDRGQMEELFCKLLETANSIFTSKVDFDKLKEDCERSKNTLKTESRKVFKEIIQHSIRKETDPSFHHAAVQTKKTYSDFQEEISATFDSFMALTTSMSQKVEEQAELPTDANSLLPEIDEFCDSMEDFVNQTTIMAIPEHIRREMSPALREGLDRTLQPLREKALQLIKKVGQEKVLQQRFSTYTQICSGFHDVQRYLAEIEHFSTPPFLLRNLAQACDDIENLSATIRDQISPLIQAKLPALAADLHGFSQAAAVQAAILKEATKRVHASEWLMKDDGPIDRLVRYHQRDRTLHGFNPVPVLADVRAQIGVLEEDQEELTGLIQDMEKYVSHSKLGDWNPFKAYILNQIAPDLQEIAQAQLDTLFKDLKRSHDFSEEAFRRRAQQFLESFDGKYRLDLEPLLNQIHDFLSENSIIKAKLRRYKDRIHAIHLAHETRQNSASNGLTQALTQLKTIADEEAPKFEQGRAPTYQKMVSNVKQIRREVAQLKKMAQNLQPEKHLDLQTFTTWAGSLGGLAGGAAVSMVLPWPIVAIGSGIAGAYFSNFYKKERAVDVVKGAAAGLVGGMVPGGSLLVPAVAGGYIGHKVPNIILDYGDNVVYPAVEELLDNVLEESTQPMNFKSIYLLGLHAFSTCYGGAQIEIA